MVQENRAISCQIETDRTLVCGEMVTFILIITVEEEISSREDYSKKAKDNKTNE